MTILTVPLPHMWWTASRMGLESASITPTNSARRRINMRSTLQHPTVVDEYMQGETQSGRILGPFSLDSVSGLQIHRLGVTPKGHAPGKWRLITDLSFPEGNDSIPSAVQALGKGALLAKLDVKAADRLIPGHPEDRQLLGFEWRVPTMQTQGSPLACALLRRFSLQWPSFLDTQEVLHEEGLGITDWHLAACLQGGEARSLLPAQDDRPLTCTKAPLSSCVPEL